MADSVLKEISKIAQLNFRDQAIYFLNAYWIEFGKKEGKFETQGPEHVWKLREVIKSIDQDQIAEEKKQAWDAQFTGYKEGNALNEVYARKFLEKIGQTLTAIAFRSKFKELDVDGDKKMSLVEYLLLEYGVKPADLVKRPQGANEALLKVQADLEEVKKQISAVEKEKADLSAAAQAGGVKGNAAKASLAQLESADNIHLRKALTSAEAGFRAVQKEVGAPAGGVWWLQREIEEAKKYQKGGKGKH
jgi:hypothetical protein